MPHQANRLGNAHGGEIMKLMDTAAWVAALRHTHTTVVTARVDGVNFYRAIKVGDLVTVNAFLTFVGHSSMEVMTITGYAEKKRLFDKEVLDT